MWQIYLEEGYVYCKCAIMLKSLFARHRTIGFLSRPRLARFCKQFRSHYWYWQNQTLQLFFPATPDKYKIFTFIAVILVISSAGAKNKTLPFQSKQLRSDQIKSKLVAAKYKKVFLADRTSIIGLFPNWKCLVFTLDGPDI